MQTIIGYAYRWPEAVPEEDFKHDVLPSPSSLWSRASSNKRQKTLPQGFRRMHAQVSLNPNVALAKGRKSVIFQNVSL